MSLLTLASVKEYLKITITDSTQDTLIQSVINSAEDMVERYLGTSFSVKTYTELKGGGFQYFQMNKGPVVSVTSIFNADREYTYESDEFIIVDSKIYRAYKNVVTAHRWPSDSFQITYTAGYTSASVPLGIHQAILLIVARFWDNRGGLQVQSSGLAVIYGLF